jgi:hypothetical protein
MYTPLIDAAIDKVAHCDLDEAVSNDNLCASFSLLKGEDPQRSRQYDPLEVPQYEHSSLCGSPHSEHSYPPHNTISNFVSDIPQSQIVIESGTQLRGPLSGPLERLDICLNTEDNTMDYTVTKFTPGGALRTCDRRPRGNNDLLEAWYLEHRKWPYPSKRVKEQLSQISGNTFKQVGTWFANRRSRDTEGMFLTTHIPLSIVLTTSN